MLLFYVNTEGRLLSSTDTEGGVGRILNEIRTQTDYWRSEREKTRGKPARLAFGNGKL